MTEGTPPNYVLIQTKGNFFKPLDLDYDTWDGKEDLSAACMCECIPLVFLYVLCGSIYLEYILKKGRLENYCPNL